MRRAFKLTAVVAAALGTLGIALRVLKGPRSTPGAEPEKFDGGVISEGETSPSGDVDEPVIGGAPKRTPPPAAGAQHVIGADDPVMPPPTPDAHIEARTAVASAPGPGVGAGAPIGNDGAKTARPMGSDSRVASGEDGARSAEAYLDEGNVYFGVGQYALAIDRYSQAIEAEPTLVAAYYNRANANSRAARYDQALADYDRALELEPGDGDSLNNRGMLHLYREDYARAAEDFDAALSTDPTDTTIMVNRGLARLSLGQAAAALADFEHAARMDPDDGAAAYGAAQASAALGKRDDALRHVARAMECDDQYVREAASDPRLELLQGDEAFLKLLRESKKHGAGRD